MVCMPGKYNLIKLMSIGSKSRTSDMKESQFSWISVTDHGNLQDGMHFTALGNKIIIDYHCYTYS